MSSLLLNPYFYAFSSFILIIFLVIQPHFIAIIMLSMERQCVFHNPEILHIFSFQKLTHNKHEVKSFPVIQPLRFLK